MSITFRPNLPYVDFKSHNVVCYQCESLFGVFDSYWTAGEAAMESYHCESCNDPEASAMLEFNEQAFPEMNVSNTNARRIIEALGMEFDYCGSIGAEGLMVIALIKLALDKKNKPVASVQEGNMITCGTPEGYLESRFESLIEIAQYAINHDVEVIWS